MSKTDTLPRDPIALNIFQEMVSNAYSARNELLKKFTDPRKNINDECGYKETQELTATDYKDLYDREPVATRVVQLMPQESWKVYPDIYEDEDMGKVTPFEEAWDSLADSLRGKSWYQDQEGNPVWEHLRRADELSGIGHFGVLLIGIDDGLPLNMPVQSVLDALANAGTKTLAERGVGTDAQYNLTQFSITGGGYSNTSPSTDSAQTADTGGAQPTDGGNGKAAKPTQPAASAKTDEGKVKTERKLLFLRAFDESLVQITQYETDATSPRYGLPVMYLITLNDPNENHSGVGLSLATVNVHWTRVIHLADNLASSEIFGVPRCRPVYNPLVDIIKVRGGSAEMYWRGAFPGISLETHPQLGGDVAIDKEALQDDMENYMNGLQRYLALMGMGAKTLAPQVVDPSPQINVQIDAICIEIGIPVRIFKGSERGELASTEDKGQWNGVVHGRQTMYVSPRIIVPFIDRLIQMKVLPEPEGYSVKWPDLNTQSKVEKAAISLQQTQALAAYVGGNVEALVEPKNYLTKVLGWTDEEAEAVLEATTEHLETSYPDTADAATVPGSLPSAPAPTPPVEKPSFQKLREGETLLDGEGNVVHDKSSPASNLPAKVPAKPVKQPTANYDPSVDTLVVNKFGEVFNAEDAADGQWITINGTHVLVKDGKIVSGPKALKDGAKGNGGTAKGRLKVKDPAHASKAGRTTKGKFISKDHTQGGHANPGKGPSKSGDRTHSVKLPKDPRKINIDQATSALKQMGYEHHFSTGAVDKASGKYSYEVTKPGGTRERMTTDAIKKLVYGAVAAPGSLLKDLKDLHE